MVFLDLSSDTEEIPNSLPGADNRRSNFQTSKGQQSRSKSHELSSISPTRVNQRFGNPRLPSDAFAGSTSSPMPVKYGDTEGAKRGFEPDLDKITTTSGQKRKAGDSYGRDLEGQISARNAQSNSIVTLERTHKSPRLEYGSTVSFRIPTCLEAADDLVPYDDMRKRKRRPCEIDTRMPSKKFRKVHNSSRAASTTRSSLISTKQRPIKRLEVYPPTTPNQGARSYSPGQETSEHGKHIFNASAPENEVTQRDLTGEDRLKPPGITHTYATRTTSPLLQSGIANPPSDLDHLITTLQDVPNVIINLHKQYSQLIENLATRVNDQENEIEQLKAENRNLRIHVDGTSIVSQMNQRFEAMEQMNTEKLDDMGHLNDEVVRARNPVAGVSYDGTILRSTSNAHNDNPRSHSEVKLAGDEKGR